MEKEKIRDVYTGRMDALTHEFEKEQRALERQYERYKSKLEQSYLALNAFPIIESLEDSRRVLSEKSYLIQGSEENLNSARCAADFLIKLPNEEAKKTAINYLKTREKPEVLDLINKMITDSGEDTINSYIAQGPNFCLLALPVHYKKNQSSLETKLSEWMLNLLTIGTEISPGADRNHNYSFKLDFYDSAYFPFLVYSLSTQNPLMVCDAFMEKFNNEHINPKEFKLVGLNHQVSKVDYPVFGYLLNHDFDSLQKTYQKAEADFGVVKSEGPTYDEILQKAESINSPISKEQLAELLNIGVSGVNQRRECFETADVNGGKRIFLTSESVKTFVRNHVYTGKIWRARG